MKLYLQTFCSNEHWKPCSSIVAVEVSDETWAKILGLREEVRRLGVNSITFHDAPVDWNKGWGEDGEVMDNEPDSHEHVKTEINLCEVHQSFVVWTAYVDGTGDQLSTMGVYFDGLGSVQDYVEPPWEAA